MQVRLRTIPIRHSHDGQVGTAKSLNVDVDDLKRELEQTVEGEVRFDSGTRAMYAHDASNYRMPPIGVVIPRSQADVVAAIAAARRFGAPVISRGGGTAIPGQGVNVALMIDFSKYLHEVVGIDPERRIAIVEPGCILDHLQEKAKPYGLAFGPDPATHSRNTLGGMIGNNSCGIHSVRAGRTADNIEGLGILLYDGTRMQVGAMTAAQLHRAINRGGREGEIYARLRDLRDRYAGLIRERYPKIPRRVSGFNLDELLPEKGFHVARALVGTEGTCVAVLEATCRLMPRITAKSLLILGFPDIIAAGSFASEALEYGPIGCEALDHKFLADMRKKKMHPKHADLLPEGRAWLLVEFGGEDKEEADSQARRLVQAVASRDQGPSHRLLDHPEFEKALWKLREEGLGATAFIPGEEVNHEGWEDAAVPPERLGDYLRDFQKLLKQFEYHGALYGHFGDGCVHVRLSFDLETRPGIDHYRRFVEEAASLVVSYGGSLSGEHGDGQAKAEMLEKMYGPELIEAFAEFKRIWDPDGKMNPGKVVAPYRIDENLRLGTDYDPPQIQTHFQYPDDRHSFAFAIRRCVGAGVCRRTEGGTMCPSFMVTREEKNSTRGRARLLFEMLAGNPIEGGWKSEEVKDALDLCLACKGCKGDCPVQVDMATYKSEFLAHYYEGRRRPRHAYAFGFIQVWARLASLAPGFVNLVAHTPGLGAAAMRVAGMAPQRRMPRFAPYTFRSWWARRSKRNAGKPRVILWADTFNNHFHPTTAQAAVEVLEHAGFQVEVPKAHLCCGRPLYDYGFLRQAKVYLRKILDSLRAEIRRGDKVVVLEPSCCSVFRDELVNLFPGDEDAKRLSQQVFLLSEFLNCQAPGYRPPKLNGRALVHGHCHHKALMSMDDEKELLAKMGMEIDEPQSGCCGMAGAFGFEAGEHYDVSIKCGERVLLPEVRSAPSDGLIVADGFSCREQVTQETDRTPLHLSQVIKMAIDEGEAAQPRPYPEKRYLTPRRTLEDDVRTAVLVGACLYGAFRLVSWALKPERTQ
ncbi:MAG TPA: FAD-binding and (Fe-S)-binding domain-containing protein [Fimbriimonadaceae bacterium]|nr:FAD-binding and (Fe-S)-binding domain-containing protein [Fimbriimonadaceae bacterium]